MYITAMPFVLYRLTGILCRRGKYGQVLSMHDQPLTLPTLQKYGLEPGNGRLSPFLFLTDVKNYCPQMSLRRKTCYALSRCH